MLKRLWVGAGLLVALLILLGPAVLAEQGRVNVYDELNYLTQAQVSQLQEAINGIAEDCQLDLVVVITDQTQGKSSMAFADDFYDQHGFGQGSDRSGLLLLINMREREVWISTAGRAISLFDDRQIASMVNNVTSPLANRQFNEACQNFIADVRAVVTADAAEGTTDGTAEVQEQDATSATTPIEAAPVFPYAQRVLGLMKSAGVYLFALSVAVIATVVMTKASKGRVTINNRTYEQGGSFALTANREEYLRETITRTKIATEPNKSDRSGNNSNNRNSPTSNTHISSSGTTHGGGGGKF